MNPPPSIWVGIITVIFCLPFTPAGVPWNDGLRLERRQLRAADRRRADPRGRHLVARQRAALVHRPGAQRRVRGRGRWASSPASRSRARRLSARRAGVARGPASCHPCRSRPVIGLCTALERARWGVWDQQAVLLAAQLRRRRAARGRPRADAAARPAAVEDPDELLDLIDGLILAGGADVDPATYGAEPHPETVGTVPERDAFELALAARAMERDLPVPRHLPRHAGDERRPRRHAEPAPARRLRPRGPPAHARLVRRRRPRRAPRRTARSPRARAGATVARHQVAPPPGRRPDRRRASR